jgi:hypothetical protein
MEVCMAETSRWSLSPGQRERRNALGPTTSLSEALPGLMSSADIHRNTQGFTFRAGEPPPAWLKWYVGQGGITGRRSGTPFATHEPHEMRAPRDAPPVGWNPEEKADGIAKSAVST